MPTEKKILGQTQRTEQIPLAAEQKLQTNTWSSGTTTNLPASGFVASSGTATQNLGATNVSTNRVVEQAVLENVVERTFIEKRNLQNITEIHEQPVYEIHEKPIVENITAPAEVKKFGGQVLHEEVRQDQGFALPAKPSTVHHTKEEYVAQVNEAPKVNVLHQKQVNIIEQPVITEVITKPVVEINETNIERVIHERPIVTVVREQPVTETIAAASLPHHVPISSGTATATLASSTAIPGQALNVTTTDTLVQETTRGGKKKFI